MSSLKMTFSLTSLILIFALAFVAMPAMAATGGPTVTITDNGTTATPSTRAAFLLKFVFSKPVEGFTNAGDATFRYYNKNNILIGTASDITPEAVSGKPAEYTVSIDVSSPETGAVGFTVSVAADVATSLDATSPLGNQPGSMRFTLPPLHIGKVVIKATKDADDTDATDGQDYDLTFTFKDQTGAPSPALTATDHITVTPSYITAPVTVGTDAQGTGDDEDDYIYNATITHPAGAPDLTIGLQPSYVVAANVTTATISHTEEDPVHPRAPEVTMTVSELDKEEREFRVDVTITPQAKSDGTAGDKVTTDADWYDGIIKATGMDDAKVTLTAGDESVGDNMYRAYLTYDRFAKLPLTLSLDPNDIDAKYKASDDVPDVDPVTAMVGEAGDPPPAANAPAKPAAPTAMINADNDLMIDVSWTAPADGGSVITGYTVKKYDSDDMLVKTFPETGDDAITDTMLAVGPVPAADRGMSFTFTVTAMNANGSGPESDMSTAVMIPAAPTVANNPPEFPTGSAIAAIVVWKGHAYTTSVLPKATDDEGDELQPYKITPDLPAGLRLVANDVQDRTITGTATVASAETTYKFIATDGAGATAELSFKITVLEPIVPTMPTGVTAMEEGDLGGLPGNLSRTVNSNKVVTNWTAPVDTTETSHDPAIPFGAPISGYMVYQTNAAGNSATYPPTGADPIMKDATSYTIPAAIARGEYGFEVAAVNSVGTGAKSTPKAPVTVADPPSQPRDLRATQVPTDPRAVTLNWLMPTDTGGLPIVGYIIYHTLDGSPRPQLKIGSGITQRVTGLASGRHVFRVAAFNNDGLGARSISTEFSVDVPTDPTNNPPTFGDATIETISATVGTAITPQILPQATDADGDTITYSLSGTLPTGVTYNRSTRLLSGTPTAKMDATAYTYTASDGTDSVNLPFVIVVEAALPVVPVTNKPPTFGNETIANITATVNTAIDSVTLPAATDPDGEDGDITYSLSPNPAVLGLTFNAATRFFSGTPTGEQRAMAYTYTATDAKGGTASLNFTLTVNAAPLPPRPTPTGDLDATRVGNVVTIDAGSIDANGFATIGAPDLRDLEEFFEIGGTIGLSNGDATDDKNARTVVISEILWGLDLGAPATDQMKWQFIELYNTTGAAINVAGWTLTFTPGNVVPASDIDQMSNRGRTGWDVDTGDTGKSGRVTGTLATDLESAITPTNIVSMYRNINYDHVEKEAVKDTVNRDELVKGIPGGNAKGSWKSSQRRSEYNRWIYDSKRAEHFKSQPILSASAVSGTPFRINEIANDTGSANDWVELHNVTDAEASLKNYALSKVTAHGTDTKIFDFKDQDWKVPAKGYVVISTRHPRDTELASGKDISVADDQEENRGTSHLYVVKTVDLPDDGRFALILRNAHDKQGGDGHLVDVVATTNSAFADNNIATALWPLKATGAPHGNVIDGGDEMFKAGLVYQRNGGNGRGEKQFAVRGFTGIGYDRAAEDTAANGGTPGYDNGAVKEKIADLSDAEVTFSEIMLGLGEGRQNLPQWIEIYNSSMTQAVNLNGWKLHVENYTDVKTALDAVLTLGNMEISPNQTVLIVTNTGRVSDADHFPSNRIVNLWTTKAHRDALEMVRRTDQVFSYMGFNLQLYDKDNKLVDEAGNLDGNRRTRDELEDTWTIPMNGDDARRSSMIRVYDAGVAVDGTMKEAWVLADETNLAYAISETYYGDPDDYGTPGFRGGGPLPVSLSKFRPERMKDTGEIVVRWVTESELNNAGFNILRSEKRDGEFTKVHFEAGKGTTSERTAYEWKDTSAKPNVVYYYQIQDVSLDGDVTTLRITHLRGNVTATGKATTTWGEIKALQ